MEQTLESRLRQLLAEQNFAVLATSREGCPYTSLVAFAVSEDLRRLLFVTGRSTRKFANLCHNPQVALLIDNRKNLGEDLREAMAVTVIGQALEVPSTDFPQRMALFLGQHPLLEEFATSPNSALLEVTVRRHILVSRFQNVTELVFDP